MLFACKDNKKKSYNGKIFWLLFSFLLIFSILYDMRVGIHVPIATYFNNSCT